MTTYAFLVMLFNEPNRSVLPNVKVLVSLSGRCACKEVFAPSERNL